MEKDFYLEDLSPLYKYYRIHKYQKFTCLLKELLSELHWIYERTIRKASKNLLSLYKSIINRSTRNHVPNTPSRKGNPPTPLLHRPRRNALSNDQKRNNGSDQNLHPRKKTPGNNKNIANSMDGHQTSRQSDLTLCIIFHAIG